MSTKNRLRRTMMFLNTQRAGSIRDGYVYAPDSIIFDLEDAVAVSEKDSARVALYYVLKYVDYKGIERLVRINGADTPFWKEDIRASVAAGCDGIRIPKCETAHDVEIVEEQVIKAEKEFNKPSGSTLLQVAIETPLGVRNAYELSRASARIFGISIGAGDFMRSMHARRRDDGAELYAARAQLVLAARAAGVQCYDTVFTRVKDYEGLERDTNLIYDMGFDGKSVIHPSQIPIIHKVFTPTDEEIKKAQSIISKLDNEAKEGVGVFMVGDDMIDVAMLEGAKRIIALAKAAGAYKGE
jgi:citrate lyase subunit beta / citryl-CoA lyase